MMKIALPLVCVQPSSATLPRGTHLRQGLKGFDVSSSGGDR